MTGQSTLDTSFGTLFENRDIYDTQLDARPFDEEYSPSGTAVDYDPCKHLPSKWICNLCIACFSNAACHWERLLSTTISDQILEDFDDPSACNHGLALHKKETTVIRTALTPSEHSGGHDFNLLISSLLLLEIQQEAWKNDARFSTQTILNEICYMAGRQYSEEPVFSFSGPLAMRQCALANNVLASANLIGGSDGLILKCAHILMVGAGYSVENALERLTSNTACTLVNVAIDLSGEEALTFQLLGEHRLLLWLLDAHVLNISKFGDFDLHTGTSKQKDRIRGQIDPVFASRLCLRTWLLLIQSNSAPGYFESAMTFFSNWLRDQLKLGRQQESNSKQKRLACAALTRALLWQDTENNIDDENVEEKAKQNGCALLAEELKLDSSLLVELAQCCCGLVECLPRSLALEALGAFIH